MKKILAIIFAAALCFTVLCSCSKKDNANNSADRSDRLKPTENINIEELVPDEDFVGDYKNDDYTAHVEKNDGGEMVITIKSAPKDGTGYEWVIQGFFSDETYRVNYTDAVKYMVAYSSSGNERSRETVYDNGAGRITFTDTEHFIWNNSMEILEGSNEFTK